MPGSNSIYILWICSGICLLKKYVIAEYYIARTRHMFHTCIAFSCSNFQSKQNGLPTCSRFHADSKGIGLFRPHSYGQALLYVLFVGRFINYGSRLQTARYSAWKWRVFFGGIVHFLWPNVCKKQFRAILRWPNGPLNRQKCPFAPETRADWSVRCAVFSSLSHKKFMAAY